jgi:hypothetical protein
MKKIFLMMLLVAGSVMAFAQNGRRVPETVRNQYQNDYPNNQNPNWTWSNNRWHARYRDHNNGDRYMDVYYDRNGHRVAAYSPWDRTQVPTVVVDHFHRKYRRYGDNYTVYRVERPAGGFLFELNFGIGKSARKVYYDENGREVTYHRY